MHTNVNVVIPAYKPDQKLIEIFKMMEASSHPVEKIIVMNTVESDDDKEGRNIIKLSDKHGYTYNKDFIEIIDVNKEDFDHGRTRKEGATHISKDCDYILFMTQDAVPYDSELIKELPDIMTRVFDIGSGTTRTLSTLWHINAVMSI